MLKRVVAIFDATQKVRKFPGTLAGDGDLGEYGLGSPASDWDRLQQFRYSPPQR
jgi:hypothetical protein